MAGIQLGDFRTPGVRCYGDPSGKGASALRNGSLMDLTDEDWHFTIRNELDLVWYSVRAAWPELVRSGGG
jgi:hypothetical protein